MKRTDDPAAAGADPESAVIVGRLLRNRRLSRGLTLEDVERAIRFGARHVGAVEEGRFADLPPQPYGRGLVRAYAVLLGLEPEELLRVCGTALSGDGSGRGGRIFRYPTKARFVWREWAVPFTLAAAVVAVLVTRAALQPEPVEIAEPAAAPVAEVRPIQKAAALEDAPPPGPLPEESAGEPGAAPVGVAAAGVRVSLRCEGTTWVEAAADGAEPRRHELGPGQNLLLTARERLQLSLGDAGVVRINVNDRELGFIGYKGETKLGLSFTAPKALPALAPGAAGD